MPPVRGTWPRMQSCAEALRQSYPPEKKFKSKPHNCTDTLFVLHPFLRFSPKEFTSTFHNMKKRGLKLCGQLFLPQFLTVAL
eukprot:385728-Karenia_brevis.AAC.1